MAPISFMGMLVGSLVRRGNGTLARPILSIRPGEIGAVTAPAADRGAQPTLLQLQHDFFHPHGAVAAGRPLRRQALATAPADERAGLHAPARAGGSRLADRLE